MNAPTYINSTHRALARNPGGLTLEEIAGKIRAKAKKAAEQVRELHDLGMIQTTEDAGQPVYKLDEAAAAVPSQTAWMMAGDSEGGEADAPAADADGWIPWVATADSVCPVPDRTFVRVRLENGIEGEDTATSISWHTNEEFINPVVAYKIIAKAPADFATTPELQYLAPEDYADMPPADPALLAQANRALGEQLEAKDAELLAQAAVVVDLRAQLEKCQQDHAKAISAASEILCDIAFEPFTTSLFDHAKEASKQFREVYEERDDLRARLDAVTQQSIADTETLTQQIERLKAELAERDSHLHKITSDTGRSDIAQRLIDHNDDRLYHEADMLMYEASDAITMLEHERDQLRAELATERQAREALQEQAGDDAVDVKDAAVGYLVRVPKRAPLLRRKPESARAAALSAVRSGAAHAEVLAVVPVGTARRGAEWRAK